MVNLLSKKEIARIKVSYYMRLSTLFFGLLAGVFFIGGALLVPSYFLAQNTVESSERFVLALEETVGLRERAGVTEEVRALSEKVRLMREFGAEGISADFFESVIEAKPSSVLITSFSFAPAEKTTFSITGVSETRSSLLLFADGLNADPAISDVDIPISQLAVEEDLPFSIKAVYTHTP